MLHCYNSCTETIYDILDKQQIDTSTKTHGRHVLHKQETTPTKENVEDATDVSGVSSSPSHPAQTRCVFVQLGPKHNQPSAACRGEPGEGRTRREQKASVAGKASLSPGTKRRSGWGWVGGWAFVVGGVVAGEVAAEGDEGEGE